MIKMTRTTTSLFTALAVSACASAPADISRRGGAAEGYDISTRNQLPNTLAGNQNEVQFSGFLTGYSYWDNTPPGSADIARPVIHRKAGGSGTYEDPITIAVGHRIDYGKQTLDYPAGTRFYLKKIRKYAIVEDVCGDGNRPQDGPCHAGHKGKPWLDIYVDGSKAPRQSSEQCMGRLTGVQTIIRNPAPDYPVVVGALTESGCKVFSG